MEKNLIRFDELSLYALMRTMVRNIWVVVLLCASTLMCYTSVVRLNYEPQYTSSATFMVGAKDSTSAYNSLTTTQSMASVFVEVFQSKVLRNKIQEEMGQESFDGAISTSIIPETNLLIVTVTSSSPAMAFKGLCSLVDNYESVSDYIFTNAQLEVIKDPAVPMAPSNPLDIKSECLMVIVISAAAAVGAIFLLWCMRDTVQTPKAARRKLDSRVLRTIRHEVKNKTWRSKILQKNTSPLITKPLTTKGFMEDNLSLCSSLEYHMRKRGQKVIMITSLGENEGKSTVAANLALAMAERNKKVLLVDCDFRKPSLHKIFEIPVVKGETLTDYLLEETNEGQPSLQELKKHGITLGVSQPSHKSISRLLNNGRLVRMIQEMRQQMDCVILDTPPMLAAADAEAIAKMADTAMVIIRSDFMPAASINEGLNRLRKHAPDVCGVVLNDFRKT